MAGWQDAPLAAATQPAWMAAPLANVNAGPQGAATDTNAPALRVMAPNRGPMAGKTVPPDPVTNFLDTYVVTPARRTAADLTGMIGSADNLPILNGVHPFARAFAGQFMGAPAALGIGPGADKMANVRFPDANDMRSIIGAGNDAPTPTGRVAQTGMEGLIGMLPFGGGPMSLLMGAASGGGSQTAKELGAPPLVQEAAGFLPLLIGGVSAAAKFGAKGFGLTSAANSAKTAVLSALAKDGLTPEAALAKYNNWQLQGSKPEALMDLGGDSTRRLARTIYTAGGGSQGPAGGPASTIEANLAGRGDDRAQRIEADYHGTARNGAPAQNIYDAATQLQDTRSTGAQPLYKTAFEANQNMESPEIDRLLQTPALQQAAAEALTRMQNKMALVSKPDPELTAAYNEAVAAGKIPPGQSTGVGVGRGLKLRYLDYVKQALDGMIYRGGRNPSDPTLNPAKVGSVGDLQQLRAAFVKALDAADVTAQAGPNSLKPEGGAYAQARSAYSGPSQSLDALETGRGFMNQDPEITAAQLAKLSPSDQDFYRLGAARALQDQMGGAGGTTRMTAAFGSGPRWANLKRQIAATFGSEAGYQKFAALAAREANMAKNENFVLGGSQTTNKAADLGDGGGMGREAFQAGKAGVASALSHNLAPLFMYLGDASGRLASRAKGITPEVAKILAPLMSDAGSDVPGYLKMLMAAAAKRGPGFAQSYLLPSVMNPQMGNQGQLGAPSQGQ